MALVPASHRTAQPLAPFKHARSPSRVPAARTWSECFRKLRCRLPHATQCRMSSRTGDGEPVSILRKVLYTPNPDRHGTCK